MLDKLPSTTDDLILYELSPSALVTYGQVCRTTQRIAESYVKREFSINRVLSRFFCPLEVLYFRYLQSRTQMFVSGSTALQFFDRTFYPNSDLDLYVEHKFRKVIATWLVGLGYEFKPRIGFSSLDEQLAFKWDDSTPEASPSHPFFESQSNGYFGRGVANVYNFFRHDRPSGCQSKIQLITSNHAPLEIILNFHSTCVMNIITHDKAYSLYPKATLEARRSLMISTEGSNQNSARKKYASRGWAMIERPTPDEITNFSMSPFRPAKRYIGDSQCWTIPIEPKLDLPEGFVETNTWELKYNSEYIPKMSFKVLLTDCLNFSYLVVDEAMTRYLWPIICPTEFPQRDLDKDILQIIRWRRLITPD